MLFNKKANFKRYIDGPIHTEGQSTKKKIRILLTNPKSENQHNKQNQRKISSICLTLLIGKIKEIDQKDKAIEKKNKKTRTLF